MKNLAFALILLVAAPISYGAGLPYAISFANIPRTGPYYVGQAIQFTSGNGGGVEQDEGWSFGDGCGTYFVYLATTNMDTGQTFQECRTLSSNCADAAADVSHVFSKAGTYVVSHVAFVQSANAVTSHYSNCTPPYYATSSITINVEEAPSSAPSPTLVPALMLILN